MNRSTAMFYLAVALGMPAWLVDANALSGTVQTAWLGSIVLCSAIAVAFWVIDRR